MKTMQIGSGALNGSRMAYGCWRIAGSWNPAEVTAAGIAAGKQAVRAAYEAGFTVFDLADIYCHGKSEEIFGEALHEIEGMRRNVIVATKCGIRRPGDPVADAPARWDFSGDYIVQAAEASLRRMKIETIDLLMLHRPDYLADPREIAGAFLQLHDAGKVRFFGVSNFRPSLVNALQAACPLPLLVNQVEVSLLQRAAFEDGTLDQCLERNITPMAWSPLGGGLLGDGARKLLPSQQSYQAAETIAVLDDIARARGVSRTVIAYTWLLKHPSRIMPVVGSTDPKRIREAATVDGAELTREEWYRLLRAASGIGLP